MKPPEGYRPREGDVVLVPAIVRFDFEVGEDMDVHVVPADASGRSYAIPLEKIAEVISRCWKEGDAVRTSDEHTGEVIAVHGESVWVKMSDGAMVTFDSLDLQELPASNPSHPAAIAAAEARAASQE